MALCNTVHYSYGKYMNDKVRHYKLWHNMLGQSNFTIKAYEIQQVIRNYMNKPLQTIGSHTVSWLGSNNKGRNIHVYG